MRRGREFYPPKRKCTGPLSHCGTPWGMWGTPIYVTEILRVSVARSAPQVRTHVGQVGHSVERAHQARGVWQLLR